MESCKMPTMESVARFKAALDSEKGALGPFMITADPAFVEAAGYAGYDFVLLDMEHGTVTYQNLPHLIRAANVAGVCPVVRVPRGSDIWIDQALDTMVIIQAEGKKAVDNLDEILDVPGIDVLFIGPYDLSSSLGHVGEIDHPDVVECIKGIIAKAAAKGVKVGCFADTVEGGKKWRDMGVKFIGYSCDTYLFLQAAKADVEKFAQ